ncbi:septation regulator SpoVG [Peptoniphilus sp. KCTC 25270]|uniref:septation regulator SpoVG n=1 Tax=Peptoniphilus sp. KCTC 25270 TaxID=2897414 RepID=UPI001E3F212C|nr:septation regulator SpoVG [Peptoniphilus sp. KCTC 25270]MCD1148009.1 septation regulator SpoVG [Peptoniphilus sp. KCTC 25270]
MQITDIRIRKVNSDNKMKAIVSVTFDDEIAIHDIKIIDGNGSPFIAMPSRKMPNGEFRDIAHPINGEMRKRLEEAIFAKYNEFLDQMRLSETSME